MSDDRIESCPRVRAVDLERNGTDLGAEQTTATASRVAVSTPLVARESQNETDQIKFWLVRPTTGVYWPRQYPTQTEAAQIAAAAGVTGELVAFDHSLKAVQRVTLDA